MRSSFRQVVKNRRVDGIKRLTIPFVCHILKVLLCKPTFPIGIYPFGRAIDRLSFEPTGMNGASATPPQGDTMETIEALIHRRSCRKYSDRPVEAEKLARIIEAGQYAPSGMGRQPVTFVAVTDPATVERLSQLNAQVMGSNSDPLYGAKTVVVVLVDRSVPTYLEDARSPWATCSTPPMHWVSIRAGFTARMRSLTRPRAWSCWPAGPARRRQPARCRSLHSGLCRGHAARAQTPPRQRGLRKVISSAILPNGGLVDAARAAFTPI